MRAAVRKKDGKEHTYYSVVENKRLADGRVVQRHVLYRGEINSSQQLAWRKSIEVLDEARPHVPRTIALLLDLAAWPDSGLALRAALFERARRFRAGFGPPDERFVAIAGVGQETVTGASKRKDGFVYTVTRHGDGTVPADSAALDASSTYFAHAAHSDLTRDAHVASAIVDLLRRGTTKRLPREWKSNSRVQARVSDDELRRTHTDKVDWASLTPVQRRQFLQNLNEPLKLQLRVPAARRPASRSPRARRRR